MPILRISTSSFPSSEAVIFPAGALAQQTVLLLSRASLLGYFFFLKTVGMAEIFLMGRVEAAAVLGLVFPTASLRDKFPPVALRMFCRYKSGFVC